MAMHILDQLSQVKVDEVLVELIERRICIQMSGDLVAQDAKIGLEGDVSLTKRPPYQMRHTAENPEWVASVLGHSTTEMLFRVYSRFIPNLTRNDGRPFTGLLNAREAKSSEPENTPVPADALASMTLA